MPDCIFCKIIKGELPALKLYENERVFAFLDINPVNAGHALVVPKRHVQNIFDIPADDWAAVAEVVRMLAGVIERAVEADGINLSMNNREHAGQVVDHAHVHIVPRFKGDGFKLWAQRQYGKNEAAGVQQKILAKLGER